MAKTDYTRAELIAICERALKNLHPNRMNNRDCPEAFAQASQLYAVLKFTDVPVVVRIGEMGEQTATDERTIWVHYRFPTFGWFETCIENGGAPSPFEVAYLPTAARLDEVEKREVGTWY